MLSPREQRKSCWVGSRVADQGGGEYGGKSCLLDGLLYSLVHFFFLTSTCFSGRVATSWAIIGQSLICLSNRLTLELGRKNSLSGKTLVGLFC